MIKYNIPTAQAAVFSQVRPALDYIEEMGPPLVIKADGLAAGKGVVVAASKEEARSAVQLIMAERHFGSAGEKILIEECLEGEEVSVIALTDGQAIIPFASSQDHKRLLEGDQGPNTGGMGAYSPAPLLSEQLAEQVYLDILQPLINGLTQEGIPYQGFIYAGLMITKNGPKVLEFNCRLGDPEAQPLLVRMKSDLLPLLEAVVEGKLDHKLIEWDEGVAVCVVLAAQGYPNRYDKGLPIRGLERLLQEEGIEVFHAGTTWQGEELVTAGGRVLGVTALADTLPLALKKVYNAVEMVHFPGKYYRRDIARRALKYWK